MKIGIEVECEFGDKTYTKIKKEKIGVYDYHSTLRKNAYENHFWAVERDGSLRAYSYDYVGEFISKKLGIKDVKNAYIDLKNFLTDNEFYINNSCGFHHHVSFYNYQKYDFNILIKTMRERFFDLLEKQDIERRIINNIKKHYYRDYAKKFDDIYCVNNRYYEFNPSKKNNYIYKIEWRSINALGVTNVKDLETITKCVIVSVKFAIKNYEYEECKTIEDEEKYESEIEEILI